MNTIIGQLNLLDSYCYKGDETSLGFVVEKNDKTRLGLGGSSFAPKKNKGGGFTLQIKHEVASSKMVSFWRDGSSRISTGAKELVLEEIQRLVEACEGDEGVYEEFRGQCTLERRRPEPDDDEEDGLFLKKLSWSTSIEFDRSILAWHLATNKFLIWHRHSMSSTTLASCNTQKFTTFEIGEK